MLAGRIPPRSDGQLAITPSPHSYSHPNVGSASELKRLGWKVIVVWQCEIEVNVSKAARRIQSFLLRVQKAGPGFSRVCSEPGRSS